MDKRRGVCMSNRIKILNYIKQNGYIDRFEADYNLGIKSKNELAKKIYELKNTWGIKISSKLIHGFEGRYTEYRLEK